MAGMLDCDLCDWRLRALGSWIRHRKLARLWWLRLEAKVARSMNRDFCEAGSFGIITDVGKLGELHSCAGLQMPIGRAVLTSHWLVMARNFCGCRLGRKQCGRDARLI